MTRQLIGLWMGCLLVHGCADDPDTTPPPAPVVDPVHSPTSLPSQSVTGTAEPGATIEIAGGAQIATTLVDPFTAQFRATVMLDPGEATDLEVTAIDGAGNRSEATVVQIQHALPRPEGLSLRLDASQVSADDGRLVARATVSNDEPGVPLDGLEVRFELTGLEGSASQTVAADAHGNAIASFDGLTQPGEYAVTVTAVRDETLTTDAPFRVVAGRPSEFTVALFTHEDSGQPQPAASVAAGSKVDVVVTIKDEAGNPVDAGYTVETDAHGVFVDGTLEGLTVAGEYRVIARLSGTQDTADAPLVVTPGAPVSISLSLDRSSMVAGGGVLATAATEDSWGNVVTRLGADAIEVGTEPCAPFAVDDCLTATAEEDGERVVIRRAGDFEVAVNADAGAASLSASQIVHVEPGDAEAVAIDLVDATAGTPLDELASIPAGHELEVLPTVTDGFGNVVDSPVTIATDAEGALIGGLHVSRLVVAGTYRVVVGVSGSALSATEPLTVVPGPAVEVDLAVSPTASVAGSKVTVVSVVRDAYGNDTGEAASITLTPTPSELDALSPGCAGQQDPAGATFIPCVSSARVASELGTTLAIAAQHASATPATVVLTVLPAPATTIARFEPDPAGAAADGHISAGDDLPYHYRVEDAYGNPVDSPIAVTVTDPDATTLDDGVSGQGLIAGLVRASPVPYQVTARITGTGVTASFPVTVHPAIGERFVTLVPSTTTIAMGDEVILSATARDIYGNLLPSSTFTFTVDTSGCEPLALAECVTPSATQVGAGATFTISRVGVFALTATFVEGAVTWADTRYVAVQPVLDVTPPTVSLKNVRRNGALCPSPDACTWQTGDTASFEVAVADDHGISEVSYSAFFASAGTSGTLRTRIILISSGTTAAAPAFTFTIPNNTAFEDTDLVAQAVDQVGNIANSAAWPIRVREIDPAIADGKDHAIEIVGVVTGGADLDDVVILPDGGVVAADSNNDRLVQILGPTSNFTLTNLPGSPNGLVADEDGALYVTVSGVNNGGEGVVLRIDASGDEVTLLDLGNDVNTGSGNGGACEPGNGNGGDATGIAIASVLRGSVRISPNPPPTGNHVRIADADGTPSSSYSFGGGDVCAARDGLRTAFNAAPFAGLAALRGPCTTAGTDYGELAFYGTFALTPGATDITNISGNPNVTVDGPVDFQPTLFVGGRSRFVHALDAPSTGAAPPCYGTRFDYGGGDVRGVAVAWEGNPLELIVYGAERTGGTLRRQVASTGATSSIANINLPHDLAIAPSGCIIATEETSGRVMMIDPVSASCGTLPCDTEVLADGFDAVRGLAIDFKNVVATWTPWEADQVRLSARIPGASGNGTTLSSSSGALTIAPFGGGTDGAGAEKAVATVTVSGNVVDGATVSIGTHVYEFDFSTTLSVAPGRVAVRPESGSAADVARALAQSIAETEARLLVTDRTADAVIEIGPSIFDTTDCF
ncbi:MAG: hypothetical protein IV100_16920 [Myxococcales bacterium]|nr:hypothetical protein [Myxococcales bacterium]